MRLQFCQRKSKFMLNTISEIIIFSKTVKAIDTKFLGMKEILKVTKLQSMGYELFYAG